MGGSVGYSSIDLLKEEGDVNAELAAAGFTAALDVDDTDLGWKFFGGYNLNQYFGIELAYVDLGEAEVDVTITAPLVGTGKSFAGTTGFTFAGVAWYPINEKFDVFGKVGGFVWDYEGELVVNKVISDDGTSIMFGFGVEYKLGNNIGIRAEWERYKSTVDVDLFSVGVEYDFDF